MLFFKNKKTAKPKRTNSFGEDLDHLDKDGELPWGWIYANKDFVDKISKEHKFFIDAWLNTKPDDTLARYSALKSLIKHMEDVGKLCAAKGECFAKWASFSVADPNDLKAKKEELQYIEDNIDDLLRDERTKKKIRADLIPIITKEPGIIQSELYKRFDESLKWLVSNELYQLEREGRITRTKSGRSYSLFVK